jgi:hypothetical protein
LLVVIAIAIGVSGVVKRVSDENEAERLGRWAGGKSSESSALFHQMYPENSKSPVNLKELSKKFDDDIETAKDFRRMAAEEIAGLTPQLKQTEAIAAIICAFGLGTICCAQLWHIRAALEK